MDPPLILTHNHDPKVIFKAQSPLMDCPESPASHISYDDLWSNFRRISRSYNDLVCQNRELSQAQRALQEEYNTLRDTYWCLRYKHQELVDDAINARIESWRHVVRLEELKKELRFLNQADYQPLRLRSSKRKFTDIEDDDARGDSDWSASSSSRSQSFSNDTFNTPASGSSKFATAPMIKTLPSDGYLLHRQAASAETLPGPSTETRTPKRRRQRCSGHDDDRPQQDAYAHRQSIIDHPIGKSEECHEPDLSLKCNPGAQRKSPQTRSRTRSSGRRRSSLKDQNATAAAVAAALSEAAASNTSHFPSPSPSDRRPL